MQPTRGGDDGFSLVELMVVILVIAALLAIALPTFLGTRARANDRAVAANVRNAFTAARVFYTDALNYTDDPAAMNNVEPSLRWTNAPLTGGQPQNTVYIQTSDTPAVRQSVVVVGRSRAGRCFFLRDTMNGGSSGTHYQAQVPAGAACVVPGAADPAWSDAWPR
jgi:type IV pilus assembly protein PilA